MRRKGGPARRVRWCLQSLHGDAAAAGPLPFSCALPTAACPCIDIPARGLCRTCHVHIKAAWGIIQWTAVCWLLPWVLHLGSSRPQAGGGHPHSRLLHSRTRAR